jgi:uncharacterized protein
MWAAAIVISILGLLWISQRSLIYLSSGTVPSPPAGVEEIELETEDGLTLSAWFLESPTPRGVVVVFNGNAGNRAHRLLLAEALRPAGYSVVLTDYRGYGSNPGSPSEEGLALDARAALRFAREISPGPVVYFGESLGAGVAIRLATEEPPSALILRSPFASLPDVAAVHYPWLPTGLMLRDRFPNVDRVGAVGAPTLVIAGSADRIVPPEQSEQVFEAATEPRELVIVEGAGHNDRALLDGEKMIDAIVRFLDAHLR